MLIHGNALDVLRGLPTHSVDSIVTDPPAGINFMGKSWDNPSELMEVKDAAGNTIDYFPTRSRKGSRKDSPESNGFAAGINEIDHSTIGRDAFIAFIRDIFIEARRVLKPGGHALVWSLPRTSHWTAFALEEAGFEVRDSINHIFGSGMPKSHNISKAIDKLKGAERKVVGYQHVKDIRRNVAADRAAGITHGQGKFVTSSSDAPTQYYDAPITEPGSQEAAQYAGYGTGLKPAHETWWLVRSPISEKTIAENVLTYGTGAINIDASRIASQGANLARLNSEGVNGWKNGSGGPNSAVTDPIAASGRWPANVLLSHSVFCQPRGVKQIRGNGKKSDSLSSSTKNTWVSYNERSLVSHVDDNGHEVMEDWECMDGCPVKELNQQSGNLKSGARTHTIGEASPGNIFNFGERTTATEFEANQGGASRYFQNIQPEVTDLEEWDCVDGCPVNELNKQAPTTTRADLRTTKHGNKSIWESGGEFDTNAIYPDTGGVSRYFQNFYYCAKPSVKERNAGCKNTHPTIKSISLMSYLIRMITPTGGTVLDMFGGSGTTALACIKDGFDYILIEREQEYIDIIQARIAYMESGNNSYKNTKNKDTKISLSGHGKTISKCPIHDMSVPSGQNTYKCGCNIIYKKEE